MVLLCHQISISFACLLLCSLHFFSVTLSTILEDINTVLHTYSNYHWIYQNWFLHPIVHNLVFTTTTWWITSHSPHTPLCTATLIEWAVDYVQFPVAPSLILPFSLAPVTRCHGCMTLPLKPHFKYLEQKLSFEIPMSK